MPINKQFSDDLVAGAAIRDGEGNIISSTYEQVVNKVTTLESTSTNTEYPSAAAVYNYGQDIKDDIVTTISSSAHLYQLEPGFYKIEASNPIVSYLSIYYDDSNSVDLSNNTYFQVIEDGDIKSFYSVLRYISNNVFYNEIYFIWQNTTNITLGGVNVWRTEDSGADSMSTLEAQENKVTTLSSSNTDKEYPSAKCVYDAIQASGEGIPASALVTSIDSASTDSQVPSAKCVYDLIGDINTVLATLASVGGDS